MPKETGVDEKCIRTYTNNVYVNPAKRNVPLLQNEMCFFRIKRNVTKIRNTQHNKNI
ncbi:hypothetical protein HMPREF0663_11915 [Hoylesella oralis ATCC 33269]|uniref:Uncharacterized protein n=1 Tax=Hoylesella oralis ATCC 33269 TaxID=873533 RepID=E7RRW4_9BACT|nr:hypothetical protein HMPREF0663_11915 [Hoylesella oralis ATCC 33269]